MRALLKEKLGWKTGMSNGQDYCYHCAGKREAK
jgi:hypothetical protein